MIIFDKNLTALRGRVNVFKLRLLHEDVYNPTYIYGLTIPKIW